MVKCVGIKEITTLSNRFHINEEIKCGLFDQQKEQQQHLKLISFTIFSSYI